MKPRFRTVRDERGVALPLALFALMMLSGLLLAFLSMAGIEPQIAANLNDVTRARYLADGGIEWAFDTLGSAPPAPLPGSWQDILTKGGTVTSNQVLPGLTAAQGTFTVTIRNDNQPGDQQLTGSSPDPGNNTTDTNGILIVTSTGRLNAGTPNQVQRQIQVVMQIIPLPPFPGAVNLPGWQADVTFSTDKIDVDGRDWQRDSSGNYALKADQSKMNYGMTTQPGVQQNIAPKTYEQRAEDGFTMFKLTDKIQGKSQAGGGLTTGVNTIAPDNTLSPTVAGAQDGALYNLLKQLKALPTTTLLASTKACQATLNGNALNPTKPTLLYTGTGSCPPSQTVDMGTPDNPKLVFFNPEREYNGAFTGLKMQGVPLIKGAGILVVLDGDMDVYNNLVWEGIVIVAGQRVGLSSKGSGSITVYGGTLILEDQGDESCCSSRYGSYVGDFNTMDKGAGTYRNSSQNIAMAQNMKIFKRIWGWREM